VTGFEKLAVDVAGELGPNNVRVIADRLAAGWSTSAIVAAVPGQRAAPIHDLLAAKNASAVDNASAVAYLRGVAAGYQRAAEAVCVDTVWTGPSTAAVPVRATAEALLDVIDAAQFELWLMTFSAREHAGIRAALSRATARGVAVHVVVETVAGAKGLLHPPEPAVAFAGITGVALWHWSLAARPEASSHLHAKLAVADRRVLLVSSANLTQAGISTNIEAGLLVRGGAAPLRVAEHLEGLRAQRILIPLVAG
jgi:phosphatidylserine/phosphatidylglycerophosphate/cardiolipin synthase-like enzyme